MFSSHECSSTVTIRPPFPGYVPAGVSKLPKMSMFWLCFPIVLILSEGNDLKNTVRPIACRQFT